jgi:hypothetical protein
MGEVLEGRFLLARWKVVASAACNRERDEDAERRESETEKPQRKREAAMDRWSEEIAPLIQHASRSCRCACSSVPLKMKIGGSQTTLNGGGELIKRMGTKS